MVLQTSKNGVTMTTMRIDSDTNKRIKIVRSHLRATNPALFTSDNSVTKKALNLYIRKYELGYLLENNDDIKQSSIDSMDSFIIKKDPSWKESRNRVDSHIDGEIRESIKDFGDYLFNKEKFDHKPNYNEIFLFLLDHYCKSDKNFINPNLKIKYIVRKEKMRKISEEVQKQVYNI